MKRIILYDIKWVNKPYTTYNNNKDNARMAGNRNTGTLRKRDPFKVNSANNMTSPSQKRRETPV